MTALHDFAQVWRGCRQSAYGQHQPDAGTTEPVRHPGRWPCYACRAEIHALDVGRGSIAHHVLFEVDLPAPR